MEQLDLRGLIHVWGRAGSGKTMFASKIAADESKGSKVEWINTDSKQSFVGRLKQDIKEQAGNMDNVTVTMVKDTNEIIELILNMEEVLEPDVSLVVIDSITRVLDMSRKDPTLWGREMIEVALPSLAGLAKKKDVNVIITSEARSLDEQTTVAVHHKTISKWADNELHIVRNRNGESSQIIRESEDPVEMGVLGLEENSLVLTQGDFGIQGV
jgi:KaiC/GvpD/RAD55 family RecA-like ATPase